MIVSPKKETAQVKVEDTQTVDTKAAETKIADNKTPQKQSPKKPSRQPSGGRLGWLQPGC
jgi:HlyD family secretion protein